MGISDRLLRLAVGLEGISTLKEDLAAAFDAAK
jgi:cystathionine beta-lyase/cystathionine gamma-synthase